MIGSLLNRGSFVPGSREDDRQRIGVPSVPVFSGMSSWINRAELKFGRLAIPGLLRYVAALNALSFILYKLNPGYLEFLFLDRDRFSAGRFGAWSRFVCPGFGWLADWLPNDLLHRLFDVDW